MSEMISFRAVPGFPVEKQGIDNCARVFYNPPMPVLYEQAVRRKEGLVGHGGPFVVETGRFTGRAPKDKFIVSEPGSEEEIWWGEVNRPFESRDFEHLRQRILAYLQGKDIFVQDCFVGADPKHSFPVRVVAEKAWQSLFARNMFIRTQDPDVLANFEPEFTALCVPSFHASPDLDHTESEAFIILNFARKLVLIGGTAYAGEIKKSLFTVMNYIMPHRDVFPMHCSANVDNKGDSAVFFGLSGTGKTSLSANPEIHLVGDDEHGWGPDGVFNFEGGCYAKVINLSPEAEPQIYRCTRRFGTILENVVVDPVLRRIDLDNESITENTRAAYPLDFIDNALESGMAPHPKNVIMLTCDAFGVLPPISRLTTDQAIYHFLSGYTAKVAGTEAGITEPQATFSTCFGAPFMVLPPIVYAKLLEKRVQEHHSVCWLINTGWSGGGYGTGSRISIAYTRRMLAAALDGELDGVRFVQEPCFGLSIPVKCPGVPTNILDPAKTWQDKDAYAAKAAELRERFRKNFRKFESDADPRLRDIL